jgi:hypothetical protein
VHAGYLKPGMAVMDLTSPLRKSPLLRDAEKRGCAAVSPRALFVSHIRRLAELIATRPVGALPIEDALGSLLPGDDESD